ncbi:sugar transferase [Microbacterium sp.]|uniref:sugar transferase n=1 Tax=Microbacterium sp. TaxID=51671 RepID=UPI002810C2FA|nr:sugar transferase [Microbacterium sp.]
MQPTAGRRSTPPAQTVGAQAAASPARTVRWQRGYARRLLATDTLIVVAAVFGAQVLRFGQTSADLHIPGVTGDGFGVAYTVVSIVFIAAWLLALRVHGTRDAKVVGSGWQEYRQVADASLRVFGVLTIGAFLLHIDVARGYLLLALPAGAGLLVVSRWVWRQWLGTRRAQGECLARTVVVGEHAKSQHIARELQRDPSTGMVITGAVTECGTDRMLLPGVPVIGGLDDIVASVERAEADVVVYAGSDHITPAMLRQFGWDLQTRNVDLVVAAALTDVAGPRIHARPVAGLSLIHVDYPEFTGTRYATKRAFDVVVSSLALLVLAPVMFMVGAMVRTDGGPALFRQSRVGMDGRTFSMLKFRSMVVGAEDMLPALVPASDGNGVLFKMRDDPRVTRLGRILRRLSVDELPQLLNVLRGDMSLVGPRPPLISEVESYEGGVERRLLVKPGITGLWQVSGRSDLSWEDSVRLDLYYVENWSLTTDLIILWRTLRAVIQRQGAY